MTTTTNDKTTWQDLIDECIDEFDFERVYSVMYFLDWKWFIDDKYVIPSVRDLRKKARLLINTTIECLQNSPPDKPKATVTSGGLQVTVWDEDGDKDIRLQFILTECSVTSANNVQVL